MLVLVNVTVVIVNVTVVVIMVMVVIVDYDRGCGCGCGCGCGHGIVICYYVAVVVWGSRSDINLNFFLLALDPQLKLFIIEEHNWKKQYIDKAKETVFRIYHFLICTN